jgi:plasmid stabilization system protein ParE
MRILVRPEARAEMREAQAWYEERAVGLGAEFARAVDVAVSLAARNPAGFPLIGSGVHRVVLRRFPYLLAYALQDESLVVLSCFHYRRDPGELRRRAAAGSAPRGDRGA